MENINQFLNQYKLPLGLSFIGIVLIIGGVLTSGINQKTLSNSSFPVKSIVKTSETNQIKVDISGAINSPGVYSFGSGSRIEDAIKVAGGFHPKVNQQFISKSLNLSQKISDGQKIYIPFQGEVGIILGAQTSGSSITSPTGALNKIGINSASVDQLNSLPGVGTVTSQKIINGRPYTTIEDLLAKKVVSRSVFEKIKEQVDIN